MTSLHQSYTARFIAQITDGTLIGGRNPDQPVSHLIIDSRRPASLRGDVFFALTTPRNDGHRYVGELIEKGVETFVVRKIVDPEWLRSNASFIIVNNTLSALQLLAGYHRRQFRIPVIGITGSNGKTIVKEWLWHLLDSSLKVVRSPKSFNSQIGVPLSVWQMRSQHEIAIIEAGISRRHEMQRLENIIMPSLGIFTNLGPAHGENFDSPLEKATEKWKLFSRCPVVICSLDQEVVIEAWNQLPKTEQPMLIGWSRDQTKPAQLFVTGCDIHESSTLIHAIWQNGDISVTIPFTDDASIENCLNCWLVMLHLGFQNSLIASRMQHLTPIEMRLELKEGIGNCSIVDDSYSNDIASLAIALDFLNQQNQHPKRWAIISDMLQSGIPSKELYEAVAVLLANKKLDRLIGIGQEISKHMKLFPPDSLFFENTDAFLAAADSIGFNNTSILVKGARVFGFENIISVLQQKHHNTVLEVNLDALVHNLNYYRAKLNPEVKVMAMVKAFSYGSGSFEIANLLQYHRVDYLAVAYIDEAVELRKAGITMPIMVMNPEEARYEGLLRYDLEPEVYNFRTLRLLEKVLEKNGSTEIMQLPIHIELDTGMRRLGFEQKEIEQLVDYLRNKPQFRVKSVFSHLAASEDPEIDSFTRLQIGLFDNACHTFEKSLGYPFLKHILNSAGISRFPDAQYNMVRLGIGLYGLSPLPSEQPFLHHVSTLKSIISQIRHISANSPVGYNLSYVAKNDMTIGVVPVGYADGLSRQLSNGRFSLMVGGYLSPIVGNISMDMCMIDLTGIPAAEGDDVIIFSPAYPLTKMASALGTIPYEVLTGISQRVKRVYFKE